MAWEKETMWNRLLVHNTFQGICMTEHGETHPLHAESDRTRPLIQHTAPLWPTDVQYKPRKRDDGECIERPTGCEHNRPNYRSITMSYWRQICVIA